MSKLLAALVLIYYLSYITIIISFVLVLKEDGTAQSIADLILSIAILVIVMFRTLYARDVIAAMRHGVSFRHKAPYLGTLLLDRIITVSTMVIVLIKSAWMIYDYPTSFNIFTQLFNMAFLVGISYYLISYKDH
jgi:hypothetical protein